jgi:hypothetical protein
MEAPDTLPTETPTEVSEIDSSSKKKPIREPTPRPPIQKDEPIKDEPIIKKASPLKMAALKEVEEKDDDDEYQTIPIDDSRPKDKESSVETNNNNNTPSQNNHEKAEVPIAPIIIPTGLDKWEFHIQPHTDLKEIVPGYIWMVEGTICHGNSLKRNMVVYKTRSGVLWLHSVVACVEEVMQKIEALGTIGMIVVPNLEHTIDLHVYQLRYPYAKTVAPRRICQTLLKGGHRIDGAAEDILESEYKIKSLVPDGTKGNELVYELPTGSDSVTLVFGDLVTNARKLGLVNRMVYGNSFKCPRWVQWTSVESRKKFREFLRTLSEKPNLRVICVSHGFPITENASQMLKDLVKRF